MGTPPEAWLVGVLLTAMAALLSVPFISTFGDSIGSAFGGNALSRAFALLGLIVTITVFALAAGLLFLAVGVVRGRRPSQLLTCFVAALIAVIEVATYSELRSAGVRPNVLELVLLVAVTLAMIVALTGRARVREFYAADRRPLAASMAGAASAYVGFATTLNGLLMSLCGPIAQKYAVLGAVMSVVGIVLLAGTWLMLGGNVAARVITLLANVGAVASFFVLGHMTDTTVTPSTLIPVGLAGLAAIACVISLNGDSHDRVPATDEPVVRKRRAGTPAVIAVLIVVTALCTASAGYGLDKAHSGSFANTYNAGDEDAVYPTDVPTSDDPATDYPSDYATDDTTDPPAGSSNLTTNAHSWTVDESLDDGTTATATISVGVPQPMASGLYNGSFEAGSGCTLTQGTDAVVPFSITVSTDDGSDENVGLNLDGVGDQSLPDFDNSVMTFETHYSDDGTLCSSDSNNTSGFGVQSTSSGSASIDGFIDITNYYSGNYSQSDIDSEANLTIEDSQSLSDSSITVTAVSSPAVSDTNSWTINIMGD